MNPQLTRPRAPREPVAIIPVVQLAERRLHVAGIGDHVDRVSLRRERLRQPIGVRADAPFDRRVLADQEDLQKRAWGGINSMAAQVWLQKIPH